VKFVRPGIVIATIAVVAAACAAPAATNRPAASSTPSAATASPTTVPSIGTTSIEVTLSDQMRIEPASMTVSAGVPVTFVVTNAGSIDHEFYLGDEEMQAHHEEEMADMGGMMGHNEDAGITVEPGQTKELTYTFDEPGEWLAGCHVPGHYPAGMKATITITD
jgi:uncharacterized cupredoxin-like copper-binding protein